MIDDTLDYIDYKRDSMEDDEWLNYLEALLAAVGERIRKVEEAKEEE